MPESERITIDPAACNGDGVCVTVCPADVYDQADPGTTPTAARPEDCIRCGHCVAACPTEAVQVRGVRVAPFPEDRPAQPVTPDDLLALMRHRRSMRQMRDDPVPGEAIKQIIQAASTAPTARNARAVRVTVIEDPAMRRALLERCLVVYRRLLRWLGSPLTGVLARLFARRRAEMLPLAIRAFRNLVERLQAGEDVILFDAPVTIVLSAPEDIGLSAYDCSCAMMNGILMAESLGLGTCIIGYFMEAARRDAQMRRLMHLPDYEQVFGTFILGYPRHPTLRQIERRRFRVNWL
jgi:nitroreductase/NAD-dependent dihydropyrimidine dehydrogenase PreA subunit